MYSLYSFVDHVVDVDNAMPFVKVMLYAQSMYRACTDISTYTCIFTLATLTIHVLSIYSLKWPAAGQ